MEEYFSRPI